MRNKPLLYKLFYILGQAVASCIAITLTVGTVLLTAKLITLIWIWLF